MFHTLINCNSALAGYCQGMNYIAGVLLLVLGNVADAYQAFVVFMNGFGLAGNLISVKLEG